MNKGKAVTVVGVVLGTLGSIALSQDVQSIVSPKYAPVLSLVGTVLAALGPSLRNKSQQQQ